MRRIVVLFLALTGVALAQPANPSIVLVAVPPSGACASGLPNQQALSTGIQYSCQNGTWGIVGGGIQGPVNVSSQQAISGTTPLVYDHFIHTDGTALDALTSESGNSTWAITGSGGSTIASVSNNRLINNASPSNGYGFYASLKNTTTPGGTPQAVKEIGVVYYLCPTPAGTYDPTLSGGAIMANDAAADLSYMLHATFGPEGWGLSKFVGGVVTGLGTGGGSMQPLDCSTPRHLIMQINTTAHTVTVLDAWGGIQTITDSDIGTTIDPKSGTWEIIRANNYAGIEIGEVWMGKSVADRYASQGYSTPTSDFGALQKAVGFPYQSVTIPNAAGGGGTGWYRIATGPSSLGGAMIAGKFNITATVPGIGGQVLDLDVNAPLGTLSTASLIQLDNKRTGANPIDLARVSNDGAGNVGLDIHLSATYTTSPVTLNIFGSGIFTPVTSFPVGATAYANSTVRDTSGTGAGYLLIPLYGESNGPLGGSALTAGQCVWDWVPMGGTTTSDMVMVASPEGADPGGQFYWRATYYSSDPTTTFLLLCAVSSGTPVASKYRVLAFKVP